MTNDDETKEPPAIAALVKDSDVEKVKVEIHEKYGFWPTHEYCRDLIAFVEVIAAEMMS